MKQRFALMWAFAVWLLVLTNAAHARQGVATLTIQSVPATVVRGVGKFEAPSGLALEAEDIVETMPFTSLTRLEFLDGTVVDLGPSSRVMIQPLWTPTAGSDGALIYLLDGWAKVSMGKSALGNKVVLASPTIDVLHVARGVVVHCHGEEAEVFAEAGSVDVSARDKAGQPTPFKVGAGGFMARQRNGSADASPRPAPAFVQTVPRPFMDTLPARADLFKGQDVRLGAPGKMVYADVEAWLNAEVRIRTRFVQLWRPLAKEEAFRRALMTQLPAHPEWRHVLVPDPVPRKPASPSSASVKSQD